MEVLLKMDYEKRAKHLKKKLPKNQVKGREFSQPVRAANTNFEKGFEKTVNRVDHESRLFHLKFSRSCNSLQDFKTGIETKSLHFSENTFKEPTSEGKTNYMNNSHIGIQRSSYEKVVTSRSSNSMTEKIKGFECATGSQKLDTMSQKLNPYIKANLFPTMTRSKTAELSIQNQQSLGFSRKKPHNFNEKKIGWNGRSYRKLKEKFTAINNPPPDVRLQKRFTFHKDELQRSLALRQMVKKLCDDIKIDPKR